MRPEKERVENLIKMILFNDNYMQNIYRRFLKGLIHSSIDFLRMDKISNE